MKIRSLVTALAAPLLTVMLVGCLSLPSKKSSHDSSGSETATTTDTVSDSEADGDISTVDGHGDTQAELPPQDVTEETETAELVETVEPLETVEPGETACAPEDCLSGDYPDIILEACQKLGWSAEDCTCVALPAGPGGACNDGLDCTHSDSCQDDGTCAGTPSDASCDDGIPCTKDQCNGTGCSYSNLTGPCDDGNVCTLNDGCSNGACVSGSPDPDCQCDTSADDCEAQYGDSNACNGTLHCVAGQCVGEPDTAIVCDTSLDPQCKKTTCQAAQGMCVLTPMPFETPCDDGDLCTVNDHCGPEACIGGEPRNCDDGDACTVDSCDPVTGTCILTPTPNGEDEVCNGVDDDCDGVEDEDDGDTPLCAPDELCIDGGCERVCDAFGDCGLGEVCVAGGPGGHGECVTHCVEECPAGLGYQLHNGCHCHVPPTGYTVCRNKDNSLVDCDTITSGNTGYGQDGHFSKGALSFEDLGNGSAKDLLTGITWAKPVTSSSMTQAEATAWCNENTGGLPGNGWAMPSVYALYGLLDFGRATLPMQDTELFGPGGSELWSSTLAGIGGGTPYMYVHFSMGEMVLNDSENHSYARCAKISQSTVMANRYVKAIDNTVVDRLTGLRWSATLDCLECDWTQALAACLEKGEGWRLPNAKELVSLLDFSLPYCPRWDPALGGCPLETELWSSTPIHAATPTAAVVWIDSGYVMRMDIAEDKGGRCVMSLGGDAP